MADSVVTLDPLGILSGLPLPKYSEGSYLVPLPKPGSDYLDLISYSNAYRTPGAAFLAQQRQREMLVVLKGIAKAGLIVAGAFLVVKAIKKK